jgi:phosphatidylinositol-3-phosphatase
MKQRIALIVAVVVLVLVAVAPGPPAGASAGALPPVRHVFVINLENEGFTTTFGPGSAAPYLAQTLPAQGILLSQYYGIGHASLDNYIAQISGQAPNADTQGDCQLYTNFAEVAVLAPDQAVGQGCVYPNSVLTVADQLEGRGLTWKGYMEDMGNDPKRESGTCGHPALNTQDKTQAAEVGDQYASRHDPFVYFHSIIDGGACNNVVNLSRLPGDLQSTATTPNLVYITPNLCDDGHDSPCVDGRPGGLVSANAWLQTWVPQILASPAYKNDGMLVVSFDEAGVSDTSACCGEGPGPNAALPGLTGPGGGRTGAVVLSRWVRPGSSNNTGYNHYSLLASIEDLFGLSRLGYASTVTSFGLDVFTAAPHG